MSLRRRVTIWFLIINGATLIALVTFILAHTSRIKREFDAEEALRADQAARLIGLVIKFRAGEALRNEFRKRAESVAFAAFLHPNWRAES